MRWTANDWNTLSFWLAITALVLWYDLGPPRWCGFWTISATMLSWYDRWPLLWWAVLMVAVVITYHLLMGTWPFGGD